MAKNIVICSDGTGNSAIKDRGTNVFKIFESIDLNGHRLNPQLDPQVPIYDDGVGTGDSLIQRTFVQAGTYTISVDSDSATPNSFT